MRYLNHCNCCLHSSSSTEADTIFYHLWALSSIKKASDYTERQTITLIKIIFDVVIVHDDIESVIVIIVVEA